MNIAKLTANLLFVVIAISISLACRSASTGDGSLHASEKTAPPFPNEEPESYQTEIWQTSAKGVEKFFMMRDGEKWRMDALYGSPEQVSTIHTDKEYVISLATKVYAEYPLSHGYDDRGDMVNAMTYGMLNAKGMDIYKNLGSGGGQTRFMTRSDADKGHESIVYVDDKLELPVKKEVFKLGEIGQTPEMTITLSNFKTEPDEALFTLPTGLKRIPPEEMKRVLVGSK